MCYTLLLSIAFPYMSPQFKQRESHRNPERRLFLSLQFADDKKLHAEWVSAKKAAKENLAVYIKDKIGVTVNPNAMFDIQVRLVCPCVAP
jgi:glucan phosphorylase